MKHTHKKDCVPDFNNQIKNLCQSFDLLQEITALFQSFCPELKIEKNWNGKERSHFSNLVLVKTIKKSTFMKEMAK